jgi:hypothetical protein
VQRDPGYAGFAHLSREEALAKSNFGTARVSGTPEDLILTSPDAPAFFKRAEFLLNLESRIIGFKVFASRAVTWMSAKSFSAPINSISRAANNPTANRSK